MESKASQKRHDMRGHKENNYNINSAIDKASTAATVQHTEGLAEDNDTACPICH